MRYNIFISKASLVGSSYKTLAIACDDGGLSVWVFDRRMEIGMNRRYRQIYKGNAA